MTRALAAADSMVSAGVGKLYPGAVLLVARDGRVLDERAFGSEQLYDYEGHRLAAPPTMHTATMFDMASVTKVVATTTAVMLLVDRGQV